MLSPSLLRFYSRRRRTPFIEIKRPYHLNELALGPAGQVTVAVRHREPAPGPHYRKDIHSPSLGTGENGDELETLALFWEGLRSTSGSPNSDIWGAAGPRTVSIPLFGLALVEKRVCKYNAESCYVDW